MGKRVTAIREASDSGLNINITKSKIFGFHFLEVVFKKNKPMAQRGQY